MRCPSRSSDPSTAPWPPARYVSTTPVWLADRSPRPEQLLADTDPVEGQVRLNSREDPAEQHPEDQGDEHHGLGDLEPGRSGEEAPEGGVHRERVRTGQCSRRSDPWPWSWSSIPFSRSAIHQVAALMAMTGLSSQRSASSASSVMHRLVPHWTIASTSESLTSISDSRRVRSLTWAMATADSQLSPLTAPTSKPSSVKNLRTLASPIGVYGVTTAIFFAPYRCRA